jgi:CRP-like cAMP-binding protein
MVFSGAHLIATRAVAANGMTPRRAGVDCTDGAQDLLQPEGKRADLMGMDDVHDRPATLEEFLRGTVLFKGCDPAVVARIAPRVEVTEVPAGGHILRAGSPAEGLVILQRGRASTVMVNATTGATSTLETLQPGDHAGETAALLRTAQPYTVLADTACVVARVRAELFETLLQKVPTFGVAISRRLAMRMVQLGVTVLDGLKGSPVEFSKQLAAGSIQWVGQNQIIPKSDPSFGGVQLTPKIAAMRCGFSNLLNILSNPGIEDLIRRDFARVLALEVDRVILEGTGTSNQPMGIAQMPGVQTFALGTDGGVLGWDEVTDLLGKLEDANVPSKKLGLAFHPKVKRLLKKQKVAQYSGDTKGAYTVAPAASDEKLREILGVNFASTTQIATNLTKGSGTGLSRVYAADFSEVVLGMWGGLEIIATNIGGDAWITNSIEARLVANMDVGARHQESIVICSDAKTA